MMQILKAKKYSDRIRGLLGIDSLPPNTGLMIKPCKQVHTFFMKFAIDIVFIDKHNNMIHIETLKPFKVSKYIWKACAVVELAEGTAQKYKLKIGEQLPFKL